MSVAFRSSKRRHRMMEAINSCHIMQTKTKLQQNCQFSFNAVSNCTSKNLVFLEALLTTPGA